MKKYVQGLESKGLIFTEPTKVNTKDGRVHNGSLCYTILPIRDVVKRYYEERFENERRRVGIERKLGNDAKKTV